MQLSRITHPNGTINWVGTQGDAKSEARTVKGSWEVVEVPTDKQGLLDFINDMQRQINSAAPSTTSADSGTDPESLPPEPAPAPPPPPAPPAFVEESAPPLGTEGVPALRSRGAVATMARMEAGKQVDEIVEIIAKSKRYALARFAGAVAIAYGRFEK
jgi:hypothetical protein